MRRGAGRRRRAGRHALRILARRALLARRLPARRCRRRDEVDLGEGLGTVSASLELICADLVTTFLLSKDLKRALSKNLLFTRSDKAGVFQIPLTQKGRPYSHEAVARAVQADKPGFVSLNALPFEEALAIYRTAAGPA